MNRRMKRREFLALAGGAVAAAASHDPARVQPALPTIGFLNSASADDFAERMRAFREGLAEAGYAEGKNVAIEYRWAAGRFDRLPALAAELVRLQVSVIAAGSNIPAAAAAKAVTSTIPVVFQIGNDPVQVGLVKSLARPGGNLTGVTTLSGGLAEKKLELMRELVPSTGTIAVMINPTSPRSAKEQLTSWQAAAQKLDVRLQVVHASTERDFATMLEKLRETGPRALVIGADNLFTYRGRLLGALSARYAIPAIFQYRDFTDAGGLASYGTSFTDPPRQVGIYTGRILRGERPADLPVHQSTRIELIVNLKAAKALGLTVPLSLLGRADEVIE
jgi:putative ABC transport system substrate-binding protein